MGQVSDLGDLDKSLNPKANDMRQEPPIPVERIIVTEKPIVETQKSVDNILATFAPVIKKIVEEIKTMDESFHEQSNILIKNDLITTAETVTAKGEENNPLGVKENFIDTQKNDNFIHSDAIKKEESELAADAEVANILTVERHEKLRKTLEKHKQEQLQMMEEQKEILKDLKEQKEEIERQKQKIVKDTQELKENEEKQKVLNDKSVAQVNDNFTNLDSNSEKEYLKKRKESKSDKAVNSVPSNNENINKEQNIQMDTNRSSFSTKDVNDKMLSDNKINDERSKEIEIRSNNSKVLIKGPILNALTKRVSQKSISVNENDETIHENKDNSNNLQEKSNLKVEKVQHEYFLPIALKMRNQTNMENTFMPIVNKSEENVQAIRRDILENHEREKREINMKTEKISDKLTSDILDEKAEYLIKNFTVKDNHEKCSKQNEHMEENLANKLNQETLSENLSKSGTTEASLIKANLYLSEHGFANAVSMDPNMPIRGEYVKLKQRDLKSMDTSEDYNV
ncbi:hypothetical protein WH47_12284 [Habropoda laboriosa]|uniref:Uncharacterized protein n=2 Tax=Habropoda laboriosa TaxID=597456 RepID=A0A0L7RAR3_9HYME|nr:hypothetical protein WH47_12284 [Habropoda laboriosa]